MTTTIYEHAGHTIRINWHCDEDFGPPWKEEDGHGIVSDWRNLESKAPGDRVLHSDRSHALFYDMAGTMRKAREEQWGLCDDEIAKLATRIGRKPTRKQIIAESVERDFCYLRRWCEGDWYWCGYSVEIEGTEYRESLWGIDSDSIAEFESEALESAKSWIDNELKESADAACRDIATA